jgi:hypothetical protein
MDSAAGTGVLNALWKYSNGGWTWSSGSKLINQYGVYGTQGMLAPGNVPGARRVMNGWTDAAETFGSSVATAPPPAVQKETSATFGCTCRNE